MESKTLYPLGMLHGSVYALIAFLLGSLVLWIVTALERVLGSDFSFESTAILLGFALGFMHVVVSKMRTIGLNAAVSEAVGWTGALYFILGPLTTLQVVSTLVGLGMVSYCGGLMRAKRLKNIGYTEERTS